MNSDGLAVHHLSVGPRNQPEIVKAWITKYALTRGIEVRNVQIQRRGRASGASWYLPGQWHRTPEDALDAADLMRNKKLAAIREQAAKLEAMTFAIPTSEPAP